jgi:glucuronokinase
MTVVRRAYARAGLLGNPSDGYFGKTISITVGNFSSSVTLSESPDLRIQPQDLDLDVFSDIEHLVESVSRQGYYGGARLVKAAIKKFSDHCFERGINLESRNFAVRYTSSIPRQVGLAGSSAIVTAMMRALMDFYEVDIPDHILPNLILSAEVDELGITAGLQDRVIQVLEGCVYMDFSRDVMTGSGHGSYEHIHPSLLPDLFVAYRTEPEKVSGRVLNDLRTRFEEGDAEVISTLERIAQLAEEGREAILKRDTSELGRLMDENFDLRSTIMKISETSSEMIKRARGCGASAKFTGSGGAIIGLLEDDTMLRKLADELESLGARLIRPQVI